jgi:hypothetical protein
MSVGDCNGIECGAKLILAEVLPFPFSTAEETGEAETVPDTRDRVTARTFVRLGNERRQ